ncbi:unnamed protein product, partial [Taenia asiatica]|uniref:Calmodulin n=1 Tax=Taenia asiatica TaxID=60517 RepID=A0A0R3VW97_TAEAS
ELVSNCSFYSRFFLVRFFIDTELREIFNCFDTDGNGTISREEFAKILSVVSLNPSAVQIKLLMSQVDINGDGQIAFDEFVECFGAQELTSTPDVATLQETFRVFDKDNDGYITSDELQTVLRQMGLEVSGNYPTCTLYFDS